MRALILLLLPVLLFGQWNNGQHLKKDANTEAIMTIDYAHHEIHEGEHYYLSGFDTLNSGDSLVFSLTTPNTAKWIHLVFDIASSNILTVYQYEDGTAAGGDTLAARNNNRNSSSTSVATVVKGVTISSAGTCIDSLKWGSRSSGQLSRDSEMILKQNSTYIWVLVSGAASNVVNFRGSWYEHTSKED